MKNVKLFLSGCHQLCKYIFWVVPALEFLLGNYYDQENVHHLNVNTKGAEMVVQQTYCGSGLPKYRLTFHHKC